MTQDQFISFPALSKFLLLQHVLAIFGESENVFETA